VVNHSVGGGYSFSETTMLRMKLTRLTTMLPSRAAMKLSMVRAVVRKAVSQSMRALMTKVSKPRVRMMPGNDRMVTIGLMKALTKPKMAAMTMTPRMLLVLRVMPGTK